MIDSRPRRARQALSAFLGTDVRLRPGGSHHARRAIATTCAPPKRITDFKYVRFHAIFDDEMGVYDEDAQGSPVYNFSYVDQVYDGLLANGVKPFVELSFMPRKLAANLTPHPFWYKPLPSPPNDPREMGGADHCLHQSSVERYGKAEVESWYFEVWNEPNIDFWNGVPKEQTYYDLYDSTAKAIKAIDRKSTSRRPATAQAAWVDRFIAHCLQNHVPFDFVSSHIYGNEKSEDIFGKHVDISQRDMVARAAQKVYDQVKASGAPDTPIIWTEYNATYMNRARHHRQRVHGAVARQQHSRMRRAHVNDVLLDLLRRLRRAGNREDAFLWRLWIDRRARYSQSGVSRI